MEKTTTRGGSRYGVSRGRATASANRGGLHTVLGGMGGCSWAPSGATNRPEGIGAGEEMGEPALVIVLAHGSHPPLRGLD